MELPTTARTGVVLNILSKWLGNYTSSGFASNEVRPKIQSI